MMMFGFYGQKHIENFILKLIFAVIQKFVISSEVFYRQLYTL